MTGHVTNNYRIRLEHVTSHVTNNYISRLEHVTRKNGSM